MKFKQLPLALALTLALGAMAAGCAQDAPPDPSIAVNRDAICHLGLHRSAISWQSATLPCQPHSPV